MMTVRHLLVTLSVLNMLQAVVGQNECSVGNLGNTTFDPIPCTYGCCDGEKCGSFLTCYMPVIVAIAIATCACGCMCAMFFFMYKNCAQRRRERARERGSSSQLGSHGVSRSRGCTTPSIGSVGVKRLSSSSLSPTKQTEVHIVINTSVPSPSPIQKPVSPPTTEWSPNGDATLAIVLEDPVEVSAVMDT